MLHRLRGLLTGRMFSFPALNGALALPDRRVEAAMPRQGRGRQSSRRVAFRLSIARGAAAAAFLCRMISALLLLCTVTILEFSLSTAPAHAQNIPPTSPCAPGSSRTPAGWRIVSGSPDCSTLTRTGLGNVSWKGGSLPPVPTGDTTFASIHPPEAIGTTMTGLQSGREYRIPFFALPRGAVSGYTEACA